MRKGYSFYVEPLRDKKTLAYNPDPPWVDFLCKMLLQACPVFQSVFFFLLLPPSLIPSLSPLAPKLLCIPAMGCTWLEGPNHEKKLDEESISQPGIQALLFQGLLDSFLDFLSCP